MGDEGLLGRLAALVREVRNGFVFLPPFAIALLAALVFALPPQVHEIYRAITQNLLLGLMRGEAVIGIAALLLLSALLYAACQARLVHLYAEPVPGWVRSMPVAISILPLAGAAVGHFLARPSFQALGRLRQTLEDGLTQFQVVNEGWPADRARRFAASFADDLIAFDDLLFWGGCILFGFAALAVLFAAWLRARPMAWPGRVAEAGYARLGLSGIAAALFAATAVVVAAVLWLPVTLPQRMTWFGITCLFFAYLILWFEFLNLLSRRTGWPCVSTVLVAALLFSVLDLNDNHRVRQLAKDVKTTPAPPQTLATAFDQWFGTRSDVAAYAGRKYPVYIVAAQGGGIYAAYHAASVLASIQEECPAFAEHLFAVSGVSGGSVGVALFGSVMRQIGAKAAEHRAGGCDPGTQGRGGLVDAAIFAFSRDLLSPLQAAALFPDFLQRLLFFRVPPFDRARALEKSLEEAWVEMTRHAKFGFLKSEPASNANAGAYLSHWQPSKGSMVPALIFNTTEVHSGRRRIIAPFTFDTVDGNFLPLWQTPDRDYRTVLPDMPMSAGAFLSARFLWITPAGWFFDYPDAARDDFVKIRVVDGGYFENSGIVTALDVIDGIEKAIGDKQVRDQIEINLIVLTSAGFSVRRYYGLDEPLEPVRAMLSTRVAREKIEIERGRRLIAQQRAAWKGRSSLEKNVIKIELLGRGYPLPLGWRLSTVTRSLIYYQMGYHERCEQKALEEILASSAPSQDCVRKAIRLQLTVPPKS